MVTKTEIMNKNCSANKLHEYCKEHAIRAVDCEIKRIVNIGNHPYKILLNEKPVFIPKKNFVLRVEKDGYYTVNGKKYDLKRIPKKEGTVYLVSKICAVYSGRDDFVFIEGNVDSDVEYKPLYRF